MLRRIKKHEKELDDLFKSLINSQIEQEALIDKGVTQSELSMGSYGDLDRTIGRLIAYSARVAYGYMAEHELRIRMIECVIAVEAKIGRDITDKQEVMRLIKS
jgi:hypothetical protein